MWSIASVDDGRSCIAGDDGKASGAELADGCGVDDVVWGGHFWYPFT
jgi:hypothetical protein